MGVYRIHRDEQLIGNLLADQPFAQQLQDLLFPKA